MFTSPAISLSKAFSYFLPLLLSIVTQPVKSIWVYDGLRLAIYVADHENPVTLYETTKSVWICCGVSTFQTKVGLMRREVGRLAMVTP